MSKEFNPLLSPLKNSARQMSPGANGIVFQKTPGPFSHTTCTGPAPIPGEPGGPPKYDPPGMPQRPGVPNPLPRPGMPPGMPGGPPGPWKPPKCKLSNS